MGATGRCGAVSNAGSVRFRGDMWRYVVCMFADCRWSLETVATKCGVGRKWQPRNWLHNFSAHASASRYVLVNTSVLETILTKRSAGMCASVGDPHGANLRDAASSISASCKLGGPSCWQLLDRAGCAPSEANKLHPNAPPRGPRNVRRCPQTRVGKVVASRPARSTISSQAAPANAYKGRGMNEKTSTAHLPRRAGVVREHIRSSMNGLRDHRFPHPARRILMASSGGVACGNRAFSCLLSISRSPTLD